MYKIIQFFDEEEIKKASYGKELRAIKQYNDSEAMQNIRCCDLTHTELNEMLRDGGWMFVVFKKDSPIRDCPHSQAH